MRTPQHSPLLSATLYRLCDGGDGRMSMATTEVVGGVKQQEEQKPSSAASKQVAAGTLTLRLATFPAEPLQRHAGLGAPIGTLRDRFVRRFDLLASSFALHLVSCETGRSSLKGDDH
jgi:hypothetical protein